MPDVEFTCDKIYTKLHALNVTSSLWPRWYPPIMQFLSMLPVPSSVLLSIIFSMSYSSSCLPSQWLTTAHVTPLYKHAGSRLQVENYRPFSLTSIVCKVFESISKDEIMAHLLKNNLICDNQHGFLPKRSTQSNKLT